MAENTKHIQSLERASAIVDFIASSNGGASLGEISEGVGLGKSTTHGLIATLIKLRYLQQDSMTQRYSLGLKFLEIGQTYLAHLDLRSIALPYLRELKDCFQETVQLGILADNQVVYIEKIESIRSLHLNTYVGLRAPMYCTGLGKALLMGFSDAQLDLMFADVEFMEFTQHTLKSLLELKRNIAEARERGYVFDMEEIAMGLRCVAAPVLDHRGKPLGSISVAGPLGRFEPERMKEIGEKLKETCVAISSVFGARPTKPT